jgi:hypothetical protein
MCVENSARKALKNRIRSIRQCSPSAADWRGAMSQGDHCAARMDNPRRQTLRDLQRRLLLFLTPWQLI